MTKKNQHVVPHRSGWAVRRVGNERASSVHGTQREAMSAARQTALRQGSEMLIHGENGRIRERNTYRQLTCRFQATKCVCDRTQENKNRSAFCRSSLSANLGSIETE